MSRLTSQDDYELRIDLQDYNGTKATAEYESMMVSDYRSNYRLLVGSFKANGSAGKQISRKITTDNLILFKMKIICSILFFHFIVQISLMWEKSQPLIREIEWSWNIWHCFINHFNFQSSQVLWRILPSWSIYYRKRKTLKKKIYQSNACKYHHIFAFEIDIQYIITRLKAWSCSFKNACYLFNSYHIPYWRHKSKTQ